MNLCLRFRRNIHSVVSLARAILGKQLIVANVMRIEIDAEPESSAALVVASAFILEREEIGVALSFKELLEVLCQIA